MTGKTRRSFSRRCRIPWVGLCVAATLAALASCAPRSEHWSTAETNKHLQIDRAEYHYLVRFRGSEAIPSEGALKGLNAFLSRQGQGYGVKAWISGGDTLLDVRRQAAIMSHLRKHGLYSRLDTGVGSDKPLPGTVRVTLVRHIVTLPNCGDWSKESHTDHSNTPGPNFGCATAANLGMMAADPGSLVRGDDIGPGDGEALVKGIQNYREDKVKVSKKVNEFSLESKSNKTKTDKGN